MGAPPETPIRVERATKETYARTVRTNDDDVDFYDCEDELTGPVSDQLPGPVDLGAVDLDLCAHEAERRGYTEGVPYTVDSGAGESVADPAHIPEGDLEPSPGSLAGRGYKGAGQERLPNLGQTRAHRMLENGIAATNVFQAAKVRKPLLAVSASADKKNLTVFDHEDFGGGSIILSDAPELPMIRELIGQAQRRIKLHRENGVYLMKNWIIPKGEGFPRPGHE